MAEIENISKIIAGINPDKYTERDSDTGFVDMAGFKKALKEDFLAALKDMGKFNLKEKNALEHKIIYDSSSETLEPVYFWILDLMNKSLKKVEKIVDNFASSPGSGHFSELRQKATIMQEQAMKIMQTNGVLIKSIINMIYDLKEFELRLSQYKTASSANKEEAESGLLALKQIWMDNVDIKRGAGSINALATGNLNFVTLRDAFMVVNSLEDVKKADLNDRVKRILEARLSEFLKWRELSEKELRKRYEIEKTYLKNQLSSLKMYTRWAKPYLKAAFQLEQKDSKNPALVTAFNTIILELTLLGTSKFDFNEAVVTKKLPDSFRNIKLKRNYNACVLVDFVFRGIPQKAGQHYVFGGRAEVTFRAYALNDDELAMLKKKLEDSDFNEAMKLAEGMTDESLKELQEDVEYFLKPEEQRKEEKEENKNEVDVNPFLALIGMEKKKAGKEEEKKKDEAKEIKPDSYIEKMVRNLAELSAKGACFSLFDIYKKAHGMASYPGWAQEHDIAFEKSKWNTLLGISI